MLVFSYSKILILKLMIFEEQFQDIITNSHDMFMGKKQFICYIFYSSY